MGRPGRRHLLQNWQLVLVRSWRRVTVVVTGEVELQGVNDEDHSSAETWLDVAEVHRFPRRLQDVSTAAGPVHLQSHEQEATHEQVEAHEVERADAEEQGQHWETLHTNPQTRLSDGLLHNQTFNG